MQFYKMFKYTGKYGRYQKLLTHVVAMVILTNTLTNIGTVFLNGSMDHYCKNPGSIDNTSCSSSDYECGLANLNLPPDDGSTPLVNETTCSMYLKDSGNETEIRKCKYGWTYDRSQYESTIVSEFDLVCENSYKVSLAASSFLFGFFFGSILFGWVGDFYGRKRAVIISFFLKTVTGVVMSFSPSYWFYFVFRMLNGCTHIGLYISVFVYVNEFVAPSKRALISAVVSFYWFLGFLVLATLAYYLRSWRNLYLTISLVGTPLLIVYMFIPESPRWLLLKNQPDEAKEIILKIAKFNKRKLPPEVLDNLTIQQEIPQKGSSIAKIFRYPNTRRKTIIIVCCWFAVVLSYYGLVYDVEGLDLNIYLGTIIAGVVDFLAAIFTWFCIQKFGRRNMLAVWFIVAGIMSFINIWIPLRMGKLRTGISMTGRFFITSVFLVVYTFTSELFSTDVRSTGLGFCSFTARIAAVLAPQILFLRKLWTPLPLVVFSATSVTAGLLTLLLPETFNQPLPQTVEEAELITRTKILGKTTKDIHELYEQPEKA